MRLALEALRVHAGSFSLAIDLELADPVTVVRIVGSRQDHPARNPGGAPSAERGQSC